MAAKRKASIPSKGTSFRKAPSIGIIAGTSVEDHIAHAVEKAQKGEVIYAADYLEQKAGRLPNPAALKLLLAAAQLIDSTNPNRAKSILERAIQMDPKCGPAHLGLAVVLSNLGESKASIEHLRDAVLLPLSPAQKILTSVMLSKYNLLAPALDMAKKAFYELGKPLNQASNCLDIALQIADWDFAEELIEILRQAHKDGRTLEANEATKTHILWCDDEATNIEVIKAWSQRTFPDYKPKTKRIKENPEGRRLRIGYLSSDYRNHPTAWLANGLFRNHDKTKFELFLYDSGWDDGSDIRKEVLSNFEHIYSVADLDDVAAASLIDGHDLDILVELNGPTKANRMGILAHRPAPIQICYLGWPGSAGGRFVDYIIADEYILPQEQAKHYPEKIIWLSDTYQINDYAARELPPPPTKQELGFSEDTIVVGMFNSINKVRREVWAAWMEIIKSCPRAILWVLDPGPDARENLAKETLRAGVDLDRIVIAPKMQQMEHLRRLQVCDVILDPWPIGGHTSTADALYAGVPIMAMEGRSFSSRVSGGLLRAAGLADLIQMGKDDYVTFGSMLLANFELFRSVRSMFQGARRGARLFDSQATTRDIELGYEMSVNLMFEDPRD
jgi:predicted O-linked N-acetylglucosamine transferase (SPINDLY family)